MGDRTNDKRVMRIVAQRVRLLREALDLSQNELSRRLDLHHTAIAHIEGGRRLPSIGKLVALARELSTTTDYLCGASDRPRKAGGGA